MLSSYTAGPSGKVARGSEYINSTVTGYDQAVQTFAEGKAMFIKQGNWVYGTIAGVDADKASRLTMLPMKVNLINKKDSEEEQKAAEDFLVWLYTSDTGKDYITNKFAFVPFNADESEKLENPLSNSLVDYMSNDLVMGNDFDAFPESWGLNTIGATIQEQLFTNPDQWDENTIRTGVEDALTKWKDSIKE